MITDFKQPRETTRVLDVNDLAAVVADTGLDAFSDQLIERLRRALTTFDPAATESQTRVGFSYLNPHLGLVEWMPVHSVGDLVAVKTVGYHPDNPRERNIPSVLATTALYDTTTGCLKAICEATVLTALRTGAASAVVTDRLATSDPVTLGVVGSGAQAVSQIHAISRVRKITRIIATDSNAENSLSLALRLPAGMGSVEAVTVSEFEALVGEMDVICTCTSVEPGNGPVVRLQGAKPTVHINAVGSDFPGKTELPLDFLVRATVIPDVVDQCLVEGEAQQMSPDQLGPTMVDLFSKTAQHSHLVERQTVFDSTGWSYEDLIVAELFIEHADRLSLGTLVELTAISPDPYNPFATINPTRQVTPTRAAYVFPDE